MFLFRRRLGSQKRKEMEGGNSQILLVNLRPRIVLVIDNDAGKFRSRGCQSLGILVEHDVSLGLDELKKTAKVCFSRDGGAPSGGKIKPLKARR